MPTRAAHTRTPAEPPVESEPRSSMPLSSALQGLLSLRNDSSWRGVKSAPSQQHSPVTDDAAAAAAVDASKARKPRGSQRNSTPTAGENDSDSGVSTDGSTSTTPEAAQAAAAAAAAARQDAPVPHAYAEMPKEMAFIHHPMAMMAPHYAMSQHMLAMHPAMMHYEPMPHLAPASRKRTAEAGGAREGEPQLIRGRYFATQAHDAHYDMYPPMSNMTPMARFIAAPQPIPVVMQPSAPAPAPTPTHDQSRFSAPDPSPDSDGFDGPPTHDLVDDNSDARLLNLQKLPPQVVQTLEIKLQTFPGWDSRITSTKLGLLGGEVLPDSSPLLGEGERAESVSGYDPKKFHILCTKCGKRFTGKNAPRTFELHAIFWELYSAHPSFSRLQADREHRAMYPCNSVSRDVVVFMEAKRPCLCNNQKKIWRLQGNLHHDVSLFQGRGWIQAASDGSANVPDKTSLESVLCCRAGKLLEQYDTLRMHVYTWHDSGVFTSCASCRRVYQNTRAYLSHGCMRKGSDEEERVLAQCAQHMTTLLDTSPEFAMWFFKMRKLSSGRRDEVFDRVSKRLRITSA